MKGTFFASSDLKQLENTLKEHEPYAVLIVSTTGIDKEGEFEDNYPTRVVMKQFEFDKQTKSYQSDFTFDKMVEAPEEAVKHAIENIDSYDVFTNGGIDKDSYIRGDNVLSVENFRKDFQTAINAVKESNSTLIINNESHAIHFLDKIQSADTLKELKDNNKTLDQTNLTKAYFHKHDVKGKTTLEALRNYKMSSPKSSLLNANDKKLLDDFSMFTKKEFLTEHPNITESIYDITQKDIDRRSAKIIGGEQRIAVISNFIEDYGREEKILENEYITNMRENDAAKIQQWSERGKEEYRNSDIDAKFNTLINKNIIKPEKILAGDSQFHKLIDAIEKGDNKGIMIIHTATTGFEINNGKRDTGFPIQFAASVYSRNQDGTVDMTRAKATMMQIQAPSRSIMRAEENIRKGKYNTFKEAGIDLEEYKAGKNVLSQEQAQEKINTVFKMFPPKDYTLVTISGDFAQKSLQHLGNFSVNEKESIDAAQAIKEYGYLASHNEEYKQDIALFDINKVSKFSLEDIAQSRNNDIPKSSLSKVKFVAQLMYEVEQQQIELFRPQELVKKEPVTPVKELKSVPEQKKEIEKNLTDKEPLTNKEPVTTEEIENVQNELLKEFERMGKIRETSSLEREKPTLSKNSTGRQRVIRRNDFETKQESVNLVNSVNSDVLSKTNESLNNLVLSLSEMLSQQTQSTMQMQAELMKSNQNLRETNNRLIAALEKQNEIMQALLDNRSVSREVSPIEKLESLKESITDISKELPDSANSYLITANKALSSAQLEYEKKERGFVVADYSKS